MRIAIIGGTGKEGSGLVVRLARAGHDVIIGSRDAAKAQAAAAGVAALAPGRITGAGNPEAAAACDVAILTVPYSAHVATLQSIQAAMAGRILIDITVPLKPPKVSRVQLPPGESAALETQALLGPGVAVAAALHHVSSAHLSDPNHAIDCDGLFCTDDARARGVVAGLLGDLGLRPVDVGALRNSIALESFTPLLLHINKTRGVVGCGIRITGIPA